MLIARYAKIAISLALASFCLVVTFDNITDYGTNYLFLRHVMSMDTTFPGNALMYRSVTNPALWQLGYALTKRGGPLLGTAWPTIFPAEATGGSMQSVCEQSEARIDASAPDSARPLTSQLLLSRP